MRKRLILRVAQRRAPDFVIGGSAAPYLKRWHLLPRNPFFNVYLHCFLRSDDDRAHHDHPYLWNTSYLLEGAYLEHTIERGGLAVQTVRCAGDWAFRWGASPHRIELFDDYYSPESSPCWTVFITGPRVREWGFICPQGWIPWQRFTDSRDAGAIGRGCD